MIAFVSEFVQRLYYRFAVQADGTLEGFIADSLSCFDMRDFSLEERPVMNLTNRMGQCELGNPYCR